MSRAAKLHGSYMSCYHGKPIRKRKRSLSTAGTEAGLFRPFPSPISVVNGKPEFKPGRHQAVKVSIHPDDLVSVMEEADLIYCGF